MLVCVMDPDAKDMSREAIEEIAQFFLQQEQLQRPFLRAKMHYYQGV